MKRTIFTMIAVCGMAVMNAQTVNPLDSVDAQVKEQTLAGHNVVVEKSLSHYMDIEGSYEGNNLDVMTGSSRVVFGLTPFVYIKSDYQNGQFHPEVGAGFDYHFKRALLSVSVGYRRNTYTKYQNKDAEEAFGGVSVGGEVGYAVWQTKDHHYKVSLGAYATANLTGQKYEFEEHTNQFDFEYENSYTGRTFAGGLVFRGDFAPGFQSTMRYAVKGYVGFGQEYEYNNHHKTVFQCAVSLVVGFNAHKTHSGKISAKTGRMISQY